MTSAVQEEEFWNKLNLARQGGGLATEVGAGLALDAKTQWMLGAGPIGWAGYILANAAGGATANIAAQKLRGEEEINWGEVISSGALGIIPFTSLRFGKKATKLLGRPGTFKRAALGGAGMGAGDRFIQSGYNEGELPSAGEVATGALAGGAFGGGFQQAGKFVVTKHLKKQIEKAQDEGRVEDLKRLVFNYQKAQNRQPELDKFVNYEQFAKAKAIEYKEKYGVDSKSGILFGQLEDASNKHNKPKAPPTDDKGKIAKWKPINTLGKSFDEVKAELEEFQAAWGYTSLPEDFKYTSRAEGSNFPIKFRNLYHQHELAFEEHRKKLEAQLGIKVDKRFFPDFIHNNITFRPKIRMTKGVPVASHQKKSLRVKDHVTGHKRRGKTLTVLDEHTGFTAADFEDMRPEVEAVWKKAYKDAGKEFNIEEFHLDHAFGAAMVGRYGAGLSKKNRNIVFNEIIAAGGLLGDDPKNAMAITPELNLRKEGKLWRRLAKLDHTRARDFGWFDEKDPFSSSKEKLQTPRQQRKRINYYLTPRLDADGNPIPRSTPIQEFVDASTEQIESDINEMLKLINKAPQIKIHPDEVKYQLLLASKKKPTGTIKRPKKPIQGITDRQYELLLEIMDREDIIALFERLLEQTEEGMPAHLIQEMLVEEIIYARGYE